jgi:hypothetical protein
MKDENRQPHFNDMGTHVSRIHIDPLFNFDKQAMTSDIPKYAIGKEVLYNGEQHIVESTNDVLDGWGGHKVANTYNLLNPIKKEKMREVPEIHISPVID